MTAVLDGLARLLRVPSEPPELPAEDPRLVDRFGPAPGYRRYLVLTRWLGVAGTALGIGALGVVMLLSGGGTQGKVLLGVTVAMPLFGALAHLAAVLRFRTTWYAVGRHSLRIRRGLWKITEATITFDNVQNLTLRQGPLQRRFDISWLEVETAGGGSSSRPTSSNAGLQVLLTLVELLMAFLPGGAGAGGGFSGAGGGKGKQGPAPGTMEGLGNAVRIREMILDRVRKSRTAGLGDDPQRRRNGIGPGHLETLREIRGHVLNLRSVE